MTEQMLRQYTVLVEYLGATLGPDYEVVLHEILPETSRVAAIANGTISGRSVGAPITNAALRMIMQKQYETSDYNLNYTGQLANGKTIRSSTMFIKDGGKLVGLLCINFDDSRFHEISDAILKLIHPDDFVHHHYFPVDAPAKQPMQPQQLAAVRLAMALYGGSVTSRLFLNVRERDHLCYYCSSSFQSFTGSMAVNSGVEHADAARAEQAILKELADLCTGPITDEEFEDCRRGLLSGMNGVEDSLGGIESWYYIEVLRAGANSAAPIQSPEQARNALRTVTKDEVRDILRRLTLSVSYLLTKEDTAHAAE